MTTTVSLQGPPDAASLVATAFPAPGPVPVAVSARFAGEVGARPGSRLDLTVGLTPVPVRVADVLPAVPSAPGAAAVLADFDALTRALAVRGDFDAPVDAWWVGHPTADAPGATTRASETARLTGGPLRAGLPAVLRLLVPAALLLMLAGIILHVTFDLRARAVEVARLRGLGLTRREIRRVLLAQHIGILLPLLAAGAAVGALATHLVAPLQIRSDTGAARPRSPARLALGRRVHPARRAADRLRPGGRHGGRHPGPSRRRRPPAGGVMKLHGPGVVGAHAWWVAS
ncbi:FtsX-like permease family protein [Nonomuraea salmonea]|uniref:FtsX-like permease family protein n=1 Tax=Nonomuraea salmonea TaxID=46181 RepID=UPI00361EE7A2